MALDVVALGASKKYTDRQIDIIVQGEAVDKMEQEFLEEVRQAIEVKHMHDNKSVLDRLGEAGGKLTYDGEEISSSGTGSGVGENGATFTPSISEDGTLSWTNDKNLPNPAPVNIKGPKPVRGIDYFTGADKVEIVNSV